MIKAECMDTVIRGSEPVILTEVTILLRNLREVLTEKLGEKEADKKIQMAIDMSRMDEQEVENKALESLQSIIDMLTSKPH